MSADNDDQVHELAALYAVDALEGRELAAFEEHLEHCAQCREEVVSGQAAIPQLARVEEPPASLREHVLTRIETVDQLPADPHAPDTTERAPRPRRRRTAAVSAVGLALAAAVAAIVLAVAPWEAQEPTRPVAQQVLAADDAQRFEEPAPDGRIVVVMSPSLHAAVVQADQLPPAPTGHSYQAWWLVDSGDPVSAGLLEPGPGEAVALLEGDPAAATGVALTVEPEGGSQAPTTDPVHVVEMG